MLKYTHTHKNVCWFQFNRLCFQEYILQFHEQISSKQVYMIFMCIGFHPYAFIFHIFRKTYFDVSSSWFQVLFLTELILVFNARNKYISFTMCIRFYPCTSCFKSVSISCFCIYTSLRKYRFSISKLVFGKYDF